MKKSPENLEARGPLSDQQEQDSRRKNFLRRVRSKMLAMAMAGFITFGATSEGRANQLIFDKKVEAVPEMRLEPAITTEKLQDFEEQLKKEEPEFLEWVVKYERDLSIEIDNLTEQILNFDQAKDEEVEVGLNKNVVNRPLNKEIFKADHKVIKYFSKHPEILRSFQDKIKNNLHSIVLGSSLIDQSKIVRERLITFGKSPRLVMDPHHYVGVNGYTTGEPVTVHMTPKVFLGPDGNISQDAYINFVTHELMHGLQNSGIPDLEPGVSMPKLRAILIEGVVQNLTYEIIQYLQSKDPGLGNMLGHREYDDRVTAAVVLDAISKSYGTKDALVRWSFGMLNDAELTEELRAAVQHLGLDPGIIKVLSDFPKQDSNQQMRDSLRLTVNILAHLRNSGLTLPPEFISRILSKDRSLDSEQVKMIKKLAESSDSHIKDVGMELKNENR